MNLKGNEFRRLMKNAAIKYFEDNKIEYNSQNNWWLEMIGTEIVRKNALGVSLPFLNGRIGPVYIRRQIVKSLDGMAELFTTHGLTSSKEHAEQIIPFLAGQKSTDLEDFDLCLREVPFNRVGKNYSLFWRYADMEDKFSAMDNKYP